MGLFNWLTGSGEVNKVNNENRETAGLALLESRIDTLLRALDMRPEDIDGAGADLPLHIQSLVNSNRKIEAVKLYREEFGVGLKEAKEAVEAGEQAPPRIMRMERKIGAVLALLGRGDAPEPDLPNSDRPYAKRDTSKMEQEMLGEIRAGKKINAVKLYREMHPEFGLKEALDAINALEADILHRGER